MSFEARLTLIVALFAAATLAGLIWRARTGRIRAVAGGAQVNLLELGAVKDGKPVTAFGKKVTFLQFSGQFCSQCPPTARVLKQLEQKTPGALHIEVDITDRLDLARKYKVLQTPTTLVLDRRGVVLSRIGGAPNTTTLESELGTFEI